MQRFIDAHARDYDKALCEIQNGRKMTHWMWYIFPQLKGLGRSSTANYYGLQDIFEAKQYLEEDILKEHLIEICEALMSLRNNDVYYIFGTPDDLKLKSSMTLFEAAAPRIRIFGDVLDKFYDGERCESTLRLLGMRR